MENYRKTVQDNLRRLRHSKREMKDLFEIAFSHRKMTAYERLVDLHLEAVRYDELQTRIEAFALYLHTQFPPSEGEYVAIDLPNGPSFLIAFWGSLMAGYSPYLINSYYPVHLRHELLNRLNIKKVVSLSDDYRDYLRPDILSFPLDIQGEKPKDEWWANRFALSSTLTGLKAKIAVYEGSSIASEIENSDAILAKNPWFMQDYRKAIKVAAILPFFHIFGIMVSYLWFAFFGRTIVFFNDLSSETVRSTILRHGVTHIFAPPLLFNKLFDGIQDGVRQAGKKKSRAFRKAVSFLSKLGDFAPKMALSLSRRLMREVRSKAFGESPRFMISGGSYIDSEVLKTINAIGYPLFNGYGTTETSITGANLSLRFSKRIDGSIGHPFPSVSYSFSPDGTLLIRGTSLAKKVLSLDGNSEDIDVFPTNDIVVEKDGAYFIEGRKTDLFISGNGENVSPDMIEQQLDLPLAAAFSVLELEKRLTLILQYREGFSSILVEKEVASARDQLSKIAYGSSVSDIRLTYDPLSNPNAIKTSRAQLKKAIVEGKVRLFSPSALVRPDDWISGEEKDPTLALIEELFLTSLGKRISINENSDFFLDLGGDSLGYISLIVSIEKAFGIHFDLEKDRALRTPASFRKRIEEDR